MPPYRISMVYKGSPLYFAGVDEVRARPVAPRHLEGGEGFGVDGLKHIELPGHHDQAVAKRDRGFVGRLLSRIGRCVSGGAPRAGHAAVDDEREEREQEDKPVQARHVVEAHALHEYVPYIRVGSTRLPARTCRPYGPVPEAPCQAAQRATSRTR